MDVAARHGVQMKPERCTHGTMKIATCDVLAARHEVVARPDDEVTLVSKTAAEKAKQARRITFLAGEVKRAKSPKPEHWCEAARGTWEAALRADRGELVHVQRLVCVGCTWIRLHLALRTLGLKVDRDSQQATAKSIAIKREAYKRRLAAKGRGDGVMYAALRGSGAPPLAFVADKQGVVHTDTDAVDAVMQDAWEEAVSYTHLRAHETSAHL
eukprot:6147769-Alexandrium_andersonii.AAC.1